MPRALYDRVTQYQSALRTSGNGISWRHHFNILVGSIVVITLDQHHDYNVQLCLRDRRGRWCAGKKGRQVETLLQPRFVAQAQWKERRKMFAKHGLNSIHAPLSSGLWPVCKQAGWRSPLWEKEGSRNKYTPHTNC